MIFRQFFDAESSTYTYLIGDETACEAVLIDPVETMLDDYLQILKQLELNIAASIDTHTHADHVSASGQLRDITGCPTMLGREALSDCVSNTLSNGDKIKFGQYFLTALHTPGHTDDSYSFHLQAEEQSFLFTGDTLLIRGSGRTDFQNGNAKQQFNSLFNILLKYPSNTFVYPGHDYKGWTVSTIAEEKRHNPRLQIKNCREYVELMNNLKLPNPKLMDYAVPINQACGQNPT